MKVSDCKIIDLPKIGEPRGNLTFVESKRHVPFQIARVYYLYDVPGGAERGGHAHRGARSSSSLPCLAVSMLCSMTVMIRRAFT